MSHIILFRMRYVSGKCCKANKNIFYVQYFFFRKSHRLWGNVEKYGTIFGNSTASTCWLHLQDIRPKLCHKPDYLNLQHQKFSCNCRLKFYLMDIRNKGGCFTVHYCQYFSWFYYGNTFATTVLRITHDLLNKFLTPCHSFLFVLYPRQTYVVNLSKD